MPRNRTPARRKSTAPQVASLTKTQAQKIDTAIRETADAVQDAANEFSEQWSKLTRLVLEAKMVETEYLSILGYKSWPAYLVDALSIRPDNTDQRRACVAFLLKQELSTRAIGQILGVPQKTVWRDGEASEDDPTTTVATLDGRNMIRKRSREQPELTPKLRYTKAYNTLSEDLSRVLHYLDTDAEFATAAIEELDYLVNLRDALSKRITRLRAMKSKAEKVA